MVSYKMIQASNALLNDAKALRVTVFVGGTSGIGKSTIRALVATGADTRIYLVGRGSSQKRMHTFIQELHAINPKAELIWTEAEITLLSETERICNYIQKRESHIDLLFMSAGYAPFGARSETAEGLEVTQSLEYYSRMLFVLLLVPLLSKSDAPRVVSVLAGGLEPAAVDLNDLDLRRPANFGAFKAQAHYAAMNTMTLESLAESHPLIIFIHSFPGWVNTGNHRRGSDPKSILNRVIWPITEPLISLLSLSVEESGQRHLFESTSAFYGGRGVYWSGQQCLNSFGKPENGLFLLDQKCDCTLNEKAVSSLRETARRKIWDHMLGVLQPYW